MTAARPANAAASAGAASSARAASSPGARRSASPAAPAAAGAPDRPGLILTALILVAGVANLNLSVANVALPAIGQAFNSSQTALDLVAVGFSLGLAASVLYLGAVGDRYGRKMLLILGIALSVPACLLAALAPSDPVLILARILGGMAAGMAYPTTLALITALWSGPARTRPIALWSGIGAAVAAVGPAISGALLEHFYWGSVFLASLPLAVVAFVMAVLVVPSHVHETTDPVDNLGGIASVAAVSALILGINFASVPGAGMILVVLAVVLVVAAAFFVIRQRTAPAPLYDLRVAARPTFWVAACAGIVVFGSLMGAIFVGQQFLQNVLGYSTLRSGLAILPGAVFMVAAAPQSARLISARGSRFTLLTGYLFCLLGFVVMLLLWRQASPYWQVGLGYAMIGVGIGIAGTPASHSLTGSVPVRRAGMASGTADLQRDLGGAVMQSIFGALLTAGYAAAFSAAIASSPQHSSISASVQNQLTKSFTGAQAVAQRYPQYASAISSAARASFLAGDKWAYLAGIIAVLVGAVIVYLKFPGKDAEAELLASYHAADAR